MPKTKKRDLALTGQRKHFITAVHLRVSISLPEVSFVVKAMATQVSHGTSTSLNGYHVFHHGHV